MDRLEAPSLIVAMPELADPNFRRTVVLLVEQNDQGAFGLVINRPAETTIEELCQGLDVTWGGHPEARAQRGGPVAARQGFLLHGPVDGEVSVNSQQVAPGIHMALDMETFRALCVRPPGHFRMMLGYAGWGAGQLEQEVASGAWILAEPAADLVFGTPHEEIWEETLRRLGIDPTMLVTGGGVH